MFGPCSPPDRARPLPDEVLSGFRGWDGATCWLPAVPNRDGALLFRAAAGFAD